MENDIGLDPLRQVRRNLSGMGHPKAAIYLANMRKRKRKALQELKHKPCTDCGQILVPVCMDFDHLADKTMDVAALVKYAGMERVKTEIAKCELVCVLCHRTRTYNRNLLLPRSDSASAKYRTKKRQLAWIAKGKPCCECGIQYQPWQMDFDHRSGEAKVADVSTLMLNGTISNLQIEIAKCDVICAACHRIKTFGNLEHLQ